MQAPSICPMYQVGTYNVSFYDDNHPNGIYRIGPNNFTQENISQPTIIMKEIEAGHLYYQYQITVCSEGITHTLMGTFSEYINLSR